MEREPRAGEMARMIAEDIGGGGDGERFVRVASERAERSEASERVEKPWKTGEGKEALSARVFELISHQSMVKTQFETYLRPGPSRKYLYRYPERGYIASSCRHFRGSAVAQFRGERHGRFWKMTSLTCDLTSYHVTRPRLDQDT